MYDNKEKMDALRKSIVDLEKEISRVGDRKPVNAGMLSLYKELTDRKNALKGACSDLSKFYDIIGTFVKLTDSYKGKR